MLHPSGSPRAGQILPIYVVPIEIRSPETLLKTSALQSAILKSTYFSSIATDEKGVIQIFNVGAERMLGYSATDILNCITPAEISDALELTARAKLLSLEFETSITPGFEALVFKAARGIEDIYELTYICKDGSRLPAIVSVTSLRDEANKILGYLLIGTDNTARKKVEADQAVLDHRLSEEVQAHTEDLLRFRSAMDATGDAIFLTDPKTMHYTEVNATACKMLGYSREELLQLGPKQIDAASFLQLKEDYRLFIAGDLKSTLRETTLHRKDGTLLQAEIHRQVHHYQGKWTIVSVVRDISERKRAQDEILRLNSELEDRVIRRTAQLQAANEELEAFSYSVSHDLRSPLNTIDGFSSLLERGAEGVLDDKAKHYLQRIRVSTQKMGQLIDGMLTLAKFSRSALDLNSVDLSAISSQVEIHLRERDPERHVVVTIQQNLLARGDVTLLTAVMDNLIGNAWKYSSKQAIARITIGSEVNPEGRTVYFVKDNGAGFNMAYADKLFGTFQRLHSPDEFSGTGIGLAIVDRIVRRHNGEIWASSAENHGADFYFTLGSS